MKSKQAHREHIIGALTADLEKEILVLKEYQNWCCDRAKKEELRQLWLTQYFTRVPLMIDEFERNIQ